MKNVACSLTIAGTDPTGGAGIQADLKTFQELRSYGMSVITSVVAQNTTGVQAVHHVPLEVIEKQLDAVLLDMPVDAFKTGMIANMEMMKLIGKKMASLSAPYIMDPVMVATSGDPLVAEDARLYLREHLLPLTTLVTPNIPEAMSITGHQIESEADMQEAAAEIVHKYGSKAVLVKGGHLQGDAIDYLYDGNKMQRFYAKRIATENTHGTGCTLSAAITAYMSRGIPLQESVAKAKHYVTMAIQHSFALGQGNGPTNHWGISLAEIKQ